MKKIILATLILAALFTLSNNTFAQDLPGFSITVKWEFCGSLVEGADVYIYYCNSETKITNGKTNSNGVCELRSNMPGNCPYNVDVKVYYPSIDDISRTGQLYCVERSCNTVNYQVCLGPPQSPGK